jgi:hypothetical protein
VEGYITLQDHSHVSMGTVQDIQHHPESVAAKSCSLQLDKLTYYSTLSTLHISKIYTTQYINMAVYFGEGKKLCSFCVYFGSDFTACTSEAFFSPCVSMW